MIKYIFHKNICSSNYHICYCICYQRSMKETKKNFCCCFIPNLFSYCFVDVVVIWLLFGVNEKMLTQHISGPATKYKLLYVSNQHRAGTRAWARVRSRAKG